MIKRFVLSGFISVFIAAASLHAAAVVLPVQAKETILQELNLKKYEELGQFLKANISSNQLSLIQLKKFAKRQKLQPLFRAVEATMNYETIKAPNGIDVPVGDFLQIALFMETRFQEGFQNRCLLLPKETHLSRKIEYDPNTKRAFILLDTNQATFLGQGYRKVVHKAIEYASFPQVVACSVQTGSSTNEKGITKSLSGKYGVIEARGFAQRTKRKRVQTVVFTRLYNSGDLKMAFERNTQFTLEEKMKIAHDLLCGLEALQQNGIVHRDISGKNIFLNRTTDSRGKSSIEAVLADFGCSKRLADMRGLKGQTGLRHTAPEALFFTKLQRTQFHAVDLFATGLVLYQLYYGHEPVWLSKRLRRGSRRAHYHWLVNKITSVIGAKSSELQLKQSNGSITPQEEFELLILGIINPDPQKRGNAAELQKKMQKIIKKQSAKKVNSFNG